MCSYFMYISLVAYSFKEPYCPQHKRVFTLPTIIVCVCSCGRCDMCDLQWQAGWSQRLVEASSGEFSEGGGHKHIYVHTTHLISH